MIDLYVINLPHRVDRWEHITKTFSDPDFNLIKVEGIKNTKGWIGCFESHKKCIQIAKDKGLDNIMVLEDDCIPFDINTFKERFLYFKKYLDENNDWDIFLGGTASIHPLWLTSIIKSGCENLFEFKKAYMTHMICYNNRIYDFFLNEPIIRPIDEFWHEKIKALIPVPFLVGQISGISDIVRIKKSDEKRINDANTLLVKYIDNNEFNTQIYNK
jgi:GR25 family glycosyltransferase involved in LPS biosynthesis